jgi:hypothetical protein
MMGLVDCGSSGIELVRVGCGKLGTLLLNQALLPLELEFGLLLLDLETILSNESSFLLQLELILSGLEAS